MAFFFHTVRMSKETSALELGGRKGFDKLGKTGSHTDMPSTGMTRSVLLFAQHTEVQLFDFVACFCLVFRCLLYM